MDLAASLTLVAAEMSLQLAPSPLMAVPVMLASISKAASRHERRTQKDISGRNVHPLRSRENHQE